MKSKLLFLLALINLFVLKGQNIVPFNNFYMLNLQYYNPAMASLDSKKSIGIIGRSHYLGYEERTPAYYFQNRSFYRSKKGINSLQINGNTFFKMKNNFTIGIGATSLINSDAFIFTNQNKLSLNLQKKLNENIFSFGINITNNNYTINGEPYSYIIFGMPNKFNNNKISNFNYDLGIAYRATKNNFYIGLSAFDIIENKHLNLENPKIYVDANPYSILSLSSGIDNKLNKNWILNTSLIANYNYSDGGFYTFYFASNFEYSKKISLGINYNAINDVLFLHTGYRLKKFRMQYGYDISINRIISVTSGGHNIGLQYVFN